MGNIEKVLLVDDDPNVRQLAKMSLERVGRWTVETAASGMEAMRKLSDGLHQPDVILLDVMMPEVDGTAVLAQMKQSGKVSNIPVIFLTAKIQSHEIERYLTIGAAGVISKPFDPLKLPKQICEIVCAN